MHIIHVIYHSEFNCFHYSRCQVKNCQWLHTYEDMMANLMKDDPSWPDSANPAPTPHHVKKSPSRSGSAPPDIKYLRTTAGASTFLGSKYGPRSVHARKRQRSQSQVESDKKRSFLQAETVAMSSGISTLQPAKQQSPAVKISTGLVQESIDLTKEDPAVLAVGHATRSTLNSSVIEISSSTSESASCDSWYSSDSKDLDVEEREAAEERRARQQAEQQRKSKNCKPGILFMALEVAVSIFRKVSWLGNSSQVACLLLWAVSLCAPLGLQTIFPNSQYCLFTNKFKVQISCVQKAE